MSLPNNPMEYNTPYPRNSSFRQCYDCLENRLLFNLLCIENVWNNFIKIILT